MKHLLTVSLLLLLAGSASAGGNHKEEKSKEKLDINISIHADKNGDVHFNGSASDVKEIEKLVNKCLRNTSVRINGGERKDAKSFDVSLSIKEK